MRKINSRAKGANTARDKITGKFIPRSNMWVEKASEKQLECYTSNGELLFFTDLELKERLVKYNWCKLANGYASTHIEGKQIPIHRFLLNPDKEKVVDHINRNKKDNRISNLRIADKSLNALNCDVRKTNKSGYTGVWFRNDTGKWCAEIKRYGKKYCLGCYESIDEAIKVRKKAEVLLRVD